MDRYISLLIDRYLRHTLAPFDTCILRDVSIKLLLLLLPSHLLSFPCSHAFIRDAVLLHICMHGHSILPFPPMLSLPGATPCRSRVWSARARHGCPSEKSSLKHRNQLPDDHASRHMHAYGSACFMNARARACQVQIDRLTKQQRTELILPITEYS
jgi:hypothetical protein